MGVWGVGGCFTELHGEGTEGHRGKICFSDRLKLLGFSIAFAQLVGFSEPEDWFHTGN